MWNRMFQDFSARDMRYTWPEEKKMQNKLGIPEDKFLQSEADILSVKKTLLEINPLMFDDLNKDYLCELHSFMYGDLFDAGKIRTSEIDHRKAIELEAVDASLEEILEFIKENDYFLSMNQEDTFKCLGEVLTELFKIHPFEAGTSYTISAFVGQIGKIAGFELDYTKISKDDIKQSVSFDFIDISDKLEWLAVSIDSSEQKKYIESISPKGVLPIFERLEREGSLQDRMKKPLLKRISEAQSFGSNSKDYSKGQSFGSQDIGR